MNFLVTEGYVDAAAAFEQESGTDAGVQLSSITDRMDIRKAVQAGDVPAAMERVNDLNPEVCWGMALGLGGAAAAAGGCCRCVPQPEVRVCWGTALGTGGAAGCCQRVPPPAPSPADAPLRGRPT